MPAVSPGGESGSTHQSEQAKSANQNAAAERELYPHRAPDALTTVDEHGHRRWVYPAPIHGVFMRWRRWLGYFVIAVFFAMPWIEIGGMPAILLQIPERRFILFGHVFWPQDVFYLVFLLIGLAITLFFFTALAGRVWCGWLCPQTVFMEEIFRRIEEWVEGDHHARRSLDAAPMSLNKASRKGVKHALFLGFSALVSNTFLAYFVGSEELLHWMTRSPAEHWSAFLIMAGILGLFYFDFAWFREQFCTVLCPYARFQAVLTDAHTVQVGYDIVRGEPRGRIGTTTGDCIDCHKCVVVCPTAIDIRDGFQLECIGCARCVDACDSIMERIGKPRGLIRYDSLERLSGAKTRLFRPRVIVYSLLLVAVAVALFVGLGTRPTLDLAVLRPPGEPFIVLPGRIVSNHFTLSLHNMATERRLYRVAVVGPPDAGMILPTNPVTLQAGEMRRLEAFVIIPGATADSGHVPLRIQVYEDDKLRAERETTFLAPSHHAEEDEEHGPDDDEKEGDDD